MKVDGRMDSEGIRSLDQIDEGQGWEELEEFWDDASGKKLDPSGVRRARMEE